MAVNEITLFFHEVYLKDSYTMIVTANVVPVVGWFDMKMIYHVIGAGQSLVYCIVLVISGIDSDEIE